MSKRKSSSVSESPNKRAKPGVGDEEEDENIGVYGDQSDPLLSNQASTVSVILLYHM